MSRSVLVRQLNSARDGFCGVGTRLVKLKLNRLARDCPRARTLRLALEIEDCSTQAKKYRGDWREKKYADKYRLILDLVRLCRIEGWTHGKQSSGEGFSRFVVYFELERCEQISFHCNLDEKEQRMIPDYEGSWDGLRHSTLAKLERAIKNLLDEERSLFNG